MVVARYEYMAISTTPGRNEPFVENSKSETRNPKQIQMTEIQNSKPAVSEPRQPARS
jgi:hypothetical protein